MGELLRRVNEMSVTNTKETYHPVCALSGKHDWQLWKAYGYTYMQCSRCGKVRNIDERDIQSRAVPTS